MPTLLQINSTANWGSTGRIAEQIGALAIRNGWKSYIAYGRYANKSQSHLIKIGSKWSQLWHLIESRLFDNHGLSSRMATKRLIRQIEQIKPDIVHLHNIHGYYLNYKLLFEYLNRTNIPVVWTLHDCWPFTGHCSYYHNLTCYKWLEECPKCKHNKNYPNAIISQSERNFKIKEQLFLSLGEKLTLVPVSRWLANETKKSFFKTLSIEYIYNGVDLKRFRPIPMSNTKERLKLDGKHILVACASAWSDSKGLYDYIKLRELLSEDYIIVLIGLPKKKIEALPNGIIGIKRTQSIEELAEFYSIADVILSLSRQETFGLTIAEGMACGTPAIVYNTTALPELISEKTGIIVERVGDIENVAQSINKICKNGKTSYVEACRDRAVEHFDKDKCFAQYIELYERILNNR